MFSFDGFDDIQSCVCVAALSNVYTDVGSSLDEIRSALEEDEAGEKSLMEVVGQKGLLARSAVLQEIQKELKKYEAAHQAASNTNTELHRAMNQHIPNLRLLQGSVEELRKSLPQPQLNQGKSVFYRCTCTLNDIEVICVHSLCAFF